MTTAQEGVTPEFYNADTAFSFPPDPLQSLQLLGSWNKCPNRD